MQSDDTTVRIPLRARDGSVRAYALIDANDDAWVSQWRWFLLANGYAVRNLTIDGAPKTEYMHRELLGLTKGDCLFVDHINRDKLDNRRSNLRIITSAHNPQNVPSNTGSTSTYRGVSWNKRQRKWHAYMQVMGQLHHLGFFDEEREAAEVARTARRQFMPYATD